MKLKKIISSLLLLTFAAGLLACANSDEGTTQQATTLAEGESAATEGDPENPRMAIKAELPDKDFGGREFTIIYPEWSMYGDYYFAEEEIGEAINDAIYKRTLNVEEKFNVDLKSVTFGDINTIYPTVSKSVKAGSDDFSLALTHCMDGVAEFATSGIAVNWNKIPYVDFSKPWWNQQMNDNCSIEGVLVTAVSDYIIFDPTVIYFNKRLIEAYELENPYNLVKEGKWTWDKLAEQAKAVSLDLNGDGKFDENDQYGLVSDTGWMLEAALQGSEMFTVKKDDSGIPVFALSEEPRFGELLNKLYDLLFVGEQTFTDVWDPNLTTTRFESLVPMSSDRVLYHLDPLSAGKRYRTYEVEFGILPFPKFNEDQKDYWSLSWNGFMVVPQTADLEMVGAVSEMLAAESYYHVVPAYYDILLTSKISRDNESVEMIDIIYKGACFDFGLDFGSRNQLCFPLTNILNSKKNEYVAFFERSQTSFNRNMKKVYDGIVENYS